VKPKVRQTARQVALSLLGTVAAPPKGPFLRALYFHEVRQLQTGSFTAILENLKREGEFVDTETCLLMLDGRTPVKGRYFHLSFDDGHHDLFEHAAPVLKRLAIPSLFFVCTSWVGVNPHTLSWEDLRKLLSWGFEVGSHTRTHANLAAAAREGRLEEEVAGSKRDIERSLGTVCKYIAWPFGRKRDISKTSIQAIAQSGYQACFGAFRGSIDAGKTDPFQIPRHHLEAGWPWKHVRYFAHGHGERR
jgi:peptidoglycan/xylan/chitin deacetylase (PgdA/CDA1 family)